MREITLTAITVEELGEFIRQTTTQAVAEAMGKLLDRPMSSREVANHFGVTVQTVNRWAKQGRIKRINKAGRPVYSFNQITSNKP